LPYVYVRYGCCDLLRSRCVAFHTFLVWLRCLRFYFHVCSLLRLRCTLRYVTFVPYGCVVVVTRLRCCGLFVVTHVWLLRSLPGLFVYPVGLRSVVVFDLVTTYVAFRLLFPTFTLRCCACAFTLRTVTFYVCVVTVTAVPLVTFTRLVVRLVGRLYVALLHPRLFVYGCYVARCPVVRLLPYVWSLLVTVVYVVTLRCVCCWLHCVTPRFTRCVRFGYPDYVALFCYVYVRFAFVVSLIPRSVHVCCSFVVPFRLICCCCVCCCCCYTLLRYRLRCC